VAVVFEPRAYEFDWASYTATGLAPPKDAPWPAGHSLLAYLHALERLQIPYDVVEPDYCTSLDQYRAIVLPWPLVVNPDLPARLVQWVKDGGSLLTEASLDAFDEVALFKYPGERPLPAALGVTYGARQQLDGTGLEWDLEGVTGTLRPARWQERVGPAGEEATGALAIAALGKGRVVAAGSFVGLAYWDERYVDFERFIARFAEVADAMPQLCCSVRDGDSVQWRFGLSGGVPMLFVIAEVAGEIVIDFSDATVAGLACAVDLASGETLALAHTGDGARLTFIVDAPGYRVFRFE
jgi:beta-galactosidase